MFSLALSPSRSLGLGGRRSRQRTEARAVECWQWGWQRGEGKGSLGKSTEHNIKEACPSVYSAACSLCMGPWAHSSCVSGGPRPR